jgi:hypothetical protein
MFDRLLQWFIQEIPEELSVCEFDCCKTKCTINDWRVCELRHQVMVYERGITQRNFHEIRI